MIIDLIHSRICQNNKKVSAWYEAQSKGVRFPFYSSFDIRPSDHKIVPVDANLFPAGFNNICPQDKNHAPEVAKSYFTARYPNLKSPVLLLTEEHTKNAFYWDNIYTISQIIEKAGFEVAISFPIVGGEELVLKSHSGHEVKLSRLEKKEGHLFVDGRPISLAITNNDFSKEYEDLTRDLKTPIDPHFSLGWHRRKKSQFFHHYNELAVQFCEVLNIDPWHLTVRTEAFSPFEIEDEGNRKDLSSAVGAMMLDLQSHFDQRQIKDKPFVFVKNNSGTYGLGVTKVDSADEILNWTYKSRKKMKATKGGGGIKEVIIQEGVPTNLRSPENETAEPCIYVVGGELVGGFLRSHTDKSSTESLNSPGGVYRKLCVSDLKIDIKGCQMENVFGWVAKISALATAKEIENSKL